MNRLTSILNWPFIKVLHPYLYVLAVLVASFQTYLNEVYFGMAVAWQNMNETCMLVSLFPIHTNLETEICK